MGLKETTEQVRVLLQDLGKDLEKATRGNKAAAQRVRTGTIKLEKVAKVYRKESIAAEKKEKINLLRTDKRNIYRFLSSCYFTLAF